MNGIIRKNTSLISYTNFKLLYNQEWTTMADVICVLVALALCLMASSAADCPIPNIINSDSEDNILEVKLKGPSSKRISNPHSLLKKANGLNPPGKGISLLSNDKIIVSPKLKDGTLISILEAEAAFRFLNETTLYLYNGKTLVYKDVVEVQYKAVWKTIKYTIPPEGVLGIDRIVMSFLSSRKLKIKNIFFRICIETGWCDWMQWGACSVSCNFGKQERKRSCDCPNPDQRYMCPVGPSKQTKKCQIRCCPGPPLWTPWTPWSKCVATCGGSQVVRIRSCISDICPDGSQCEGKAEERKECSSPPCCAPPRWLNWGAWSQCTSTCGSSYKRRERECQENQCGENMCYGPNYESVKCDVSCCKVPPKWTAWSDWSECNVTCGGGEQYHTRECIPDACPDGSDCEGHATEVQPCGIYCCPKQPKWGTWGEWSVCPTTCGKSYRKRQRSCLSSSCPGGFSSCPGRHTQTLFCDLPCCEVPPKWTAWSDWSECNVTCGGGERYHTRECIPDACPDGSDCEGHAKEVQPCGIYCCPIPPKWGTWDEWSDCPTTCGKSYKKRRRSCHESSCPGGFSSCPGHHTQTVFCDLPCCEGCFDCHRFRGSFKFRKKSCKDCSCEELSAMGSRFKRRACKRKAIRRKCCATCKMLRRKGK